MAEREARLTDRIDFDGGGPFYDELKARVRAHVAAPGRARRAQRRMYAKSATVLAWAGVSWAALMFGIDVWWLAGLAAVSLGLAMGGVAFAITHDANHGSFSPHRRLERAMRWTMDLVGASSYIWRTKHNVVHHTYTNIAGADSDIDSMPFARLAPEQPRRPMHRFQHVYMWLLYGLFAIKWHTAGDFDYLRNGKIGEVPLRWPRRGQLVGFWAGKATFLGWSVALPLVFHPAWQVGVVFAVTSFVFALTLAVTFQMAHCVEEADFPSAAVMSYAGRTEWARHQVETTVDFAPGSRVLTWYMGGLNFQIEHHLFSKLAHTHLPGIAPIVAEVCERHGVRYQSHPTLWSALRSHASWLRRMGRPEVERSLNPLRDPVGAGAGFTTGPSAVRGSMTTDHGDG